MDRADFQPIIGFRLSTLSPICFARSMTAGHDTSFRMAMGKGEAGHVLPSSRFPPIVFAPANVGKNYIFDLDRQILAVRTTSVSICDNHRWFIFAIYFNELDADHCTFLVVNCFIRRISIERRVVYWRCNNTTCEASNERIHGDRSWTPSLISTQTRRLQR